MYSSIKRNEFSINIPNYRLYLILTITPQIAKYFRCVLLFYFVLTYYYGLWYIIPIYQHIRYYIHRDCIYYLVSIYSVPTSVLLFIILKIIVIIYCWRKILKSPVQPLILFQRHGPVQCHYGPGFLRTRSHRAGPCRS